MYTRRLLSDQFTIKNGRKITEICCFCFLFCITVQLGFSQFRNENCFYVMIPGLSFFPYFFFPLENIQLIFSLNFKNPTNFKMLGQCWGYNPAGRLWLFNSQRERWWMGYSGKPSTGPFIHIQSWVETWSRGEQIKIWMTFSKKQGINQGRTHTILDKIHNNFLVCKRGKSILGNSANDCFWLKVGMSKI